MLVVGNPIHAVAQAEYSGPAVVPAAEAYLGQGKPERERYPRWRADPTAGRTLWVYFDAPPVESFSFWLATDMALAAWNDVESLPITFRRTAHREAADVRFRWVRRFEERQAGTTDWETDGAGWLSSVVVTLAVEHEDGLPMGDDFLRLVALHELGHAIGLPHSEDPADVMHPGHRNSQLSDRDVRSATRLYSTTPPAEAEPPR